MKQQVLVTAVGKDRIGIVDDLSKEILDRSCNIEESRMALLGGDFAILLLISGPADRLARLIKDKNLLENRLQLTIQMGYTAASPNTINAIPYILESSSLDTPGIVHSVSTVLRRYGINITDLETNTESAPMTGAPLFIIKAQLLIPTDVSIISLRKELEELELNYNLDLRLRPAM
ncbi:glycine cleavage system protein R [Gracilinema caldarium]|uniref:Amino acid-binding ACT domain protein n=1 Tax=Gracilinema caldarium (strain ATCC 51460 / DSM 7334 / H1) TaxID=744872 RepID=F8EXE0_GRAC1|nr:ACT domain-containing protein [Gracilinema caldarium]AEJ19167.1 amino acid-binding ACT domain protein [Gracilinema caldarium DSM 7334]